MVCPRAIEHGRSRNVLVHQIESNLFARQGSALTNFSRTLLAEHSELAREILKDPYNLDFLSLGPEMLERDLERGLIEHLRSLIHEFGKGFAFVGSQYHVDVGGQDYYLDLLFYHLRLRCFVVVELKIEDFKPEFAGKINFYLSAVDDQLRHPHDQPTIGIILCEGRNGSRYERALRDIIDESGIALTPPAGLGNMLRELHRHGLAPTSTTQLLDAVRVMNEAAHGLEDDAESAQRAVDIAQCS